MRGSRPLSRATRPHAASAPCRLAVAIGSVLGVVLPAGVFAGNSTITTPGGGRDLGTLIDNPGGGSIYNVRSGKTRGTVDFNSFGRFEVGTGDTVNLHLSNGSDTVVNLVWDARALIDGTLNSYKGDEIGGRVIFADSHGLVVGESGVLNVGSLAVATPSASFMDQLVSTDDALAGAATDDLLRGSLPLSQGEVDIRGRVNARDDVRIQARAIDVTGTVWVAGGDGSDALDSAVAVNTGAGDGLRLVNDGGNLLLVAADTLVVGGTLHTDGGDIVLQSDDRVQLSGGAVVNTRGLAAGSSDLSGAASAGDSGDVVIAGRDLTVEAGALVDAHATGTHAAGDISLAAADRAGVQTGLAEASSRVRVDGSLRGGDVSLTAESLADADWVDPHAGLETIAGSELVDFAQRAGTELGGSVGYMAVRTRAEVAIGAGAVLEATGDIHAGAQTRQAVKTSVTGVGGEDQLQDLISVGALYAAIDTAASVDVAGGASIAADGTLDVSAQTENTLDVAVTSFATEGTTVAMTLALSDVDASASARINQGAALQVGGLRVGAFNHSDLSTSAKAHSDEEGAVGLAAAVSLQDIHADAHVASDVSTPGDVLIEAASLVDRNAVTAEIDEPPKDDDNEADSAGDDADSEDAVAGLFGKAFDALSGVIGEQGSDNDENDGGTPSPFRLGSAMTYTEGQHTASARLGEGATVRAGGDFALHADVVDDGIAIVARSAIEAQGKDDDNPGSRLSLSAGVAITDLRHEASAEVGDGADVEAGRIGVGAQVLLPMDFSALQSAVPDFSSLGNLMTSLQAAKAVIDEPSELFTSYVGAKSEADDAAIGGTISHYRVTNRSHAWVGDGARLASSLPADQAAEWTTQLSGDDRLAQWDQSIAVSALTDSQSLHSAGELEIGMPVGVGKGGAAVGGSFNNVVYDTTTVAGVGSGAVLASANGVAVDATTRDNIVSLALMSGGGGSIGVNGTMALLDVGSTTHASVSRDAWVDAATLSVDALQDLFVWSVSGALSMSDSLSVGLGVGVHNLRTDTRAYIGDNRADAPGAPAGTTPVSGVSGSGSIAVDALSVQAHSQGMAGAVAVAGSVAKSDAPKDPDAKPGVIERIKTSAQQKTNSLRNQAADRFESLPVLGMLADKVRGEQDAEPSEETPTEPKFGITVSGSSSVNLIAQDTRAYLDGVQASGRAGGDTRVDVAALNDTTLASASGSAAITLAKAESSKFSAAIGGAVSFSQIDNRTDANVLASTLEDAAAVAVHALSGGEQTNVALGVSVNKSSDQQSAVAVAGSFSIGGSSNTTSARVEDSLVRGQGADDSLFDVAAYNRTHAGIGGGSLYFGGRGGIGAAFTMSRIADTTEAVLDGADVAGYEVVSVRALDAARIVAGAAMAGGGGESNGLGGAVVYNDVANTTRARVGGGSVLQAGDGLLVQARSSAALDEFEQRLAAIGSADDSGFDYAGGDIALDVDGVDSGLMDSGTSIIAVAGLVQAGKNNIGLSFVGNDIDNRHLVEVGDAYLQTLGTTRLDAADSTSIIGIGFGVGVSTGKFAGMGNATANMIDNRTGVQIGAPGQDTVIDTGVLRATAQDGSFIGSLAGNVVVGSKAAAGAAMTYNHIGNQTSVQAQDADITASGAAELAAHNTALIMAGAIAGAVGSDAAISGSFAWSDVGNRTLASMTGGQVQAESLAVLADSGSDIHTLSGSVAASSSAAIGAAINIATIADETRAELDGLRASVDGDIDVEATGSGVARSLAVAGAVSNGVSVGGSSSTAQVDNIIGARVAGLRGIGGDAAQAAALNVRASNTGQAHSLAGAVSGSSNAAVGGALSTNLIGGATSAELADSILAVHGNVVVDAVSNALVNTLAGTGSASSVGIAGAVTTNIITRATRATLSDTGLNGPDTDTLVRAADSSRIDSIAGSLGFGTSVGVGAAVATNIISGDVSARVLGDGNGRYHGRNLRVEATADAGDAHDGNINTMAAGVGGGGSVGGAASVAVNIIEGTVQAAIAEGADVVSENNVGVLASNTQGVNVLAGSLGVGLGAAGVGLGVVVNLMEGATMATISGSGTRVSALAHDSEDRLQVDDGGLANVPLSDISDIDDYVAPDVAGGVHEVTGLAVNASTRQQVTTLGASGAFSGSAAVSVMAGANVVGGRTEALIDGADINRHAGLGQELLPGDGVDPDELDRQMVDVRASSHVVGANLLTGIAGSGGFSGAGALATNVFQGETSAGVRNAGLSALQHVDVNAIASQHALVIAAGLAGGIAGGAGTGVVNVFNADTQAFVAGGGVEARGLSILADNQSTASLVGGAAAGGAGAVAGTFLVNVSQSRTRARLGAAGASTDVSTRGDVTVDAGSDTRVEGVAVSGAAAGAAGIAGMAQVNVIGNQVESEIVNASIDAIGDVAVRAHERLMLSAMSGALGIGLGGTGVGAGASVAVLGSKVLASVSDSDVSALGSLAVEAGSDRSIDMIAMTGGAGMTTGIGGAASLLLSGVGGTGDSGSELDGTTAALDALGRGTKVDSRAVAGHLDAGRLDAIEAAARVDLSSELGGREDQVIARVMDSTASVEDLSVSAGSLISSRNLAGGAGVGGVGIGGAFAFTGLYGQTVATIGQSAPGATRIDARGDIDVSATNGDGATGAGAAVEAYAGAAGLAGLGAAVGVARVEQEVRASAGGNLAGSGSLAVSAQDQGTIDVLAHGAAAGALAAGIVVADGYRSGTVAAGLQAGTRADGFSAVTVNALAAGGTAAEGIGAAGGLAAAGTGVAVNAGDDSGVIAEIGDGASVNTGADGTTVQASGVQDVSARGVGAAVSAGVGLGAVVVEAASAISARAAVGNQVVFGGAGGLDIAASIDHVEPAGVRADAVAGSGGLYLSASASSASARNQASAIAETGQGLETPIGDLRVAATNLTSQVANATGVSVGGVAAGAVLASAESDTVTWAHLGDGAGHQQEAGIGSGAVLVQANGRDANQAHAEAGSGGIVAGNAAVASTGSLADVSATIGDSVMLAAERVAVHALHESAYGGSADSRNAAALGASGAIMRHVADADVHAGIGADSLLVAGHDIGVLAANVFENLGESTASAAGGGVVTGSAAGTSTRLGGRSTAHVGARTELESGVDPSVAFNGDISIVAASQASTRDTAELSTGGAIDVATVDSSVDAQFDNAVGIGAGARLDSGGYVNIGTYTQGLFTSNALVNTWGLAAVGRARSSVAVDDRHDVDIGRDASIRSVRNTYIVAGSDALGLRDSRIGVASSAEGYVRGMIAVPSAAANVDVSSASHTRLDSGSQVLSGSNVTLGAAESTLNLSANGIGRGYQLGFIPTAQRSATVRGVAAGDLVIDGSVVAGRDNALEVEVLEDGTVVYHAGLVPVLKYDDFDMGEFLDQLCGDDPERDSCKAIAALRNVVGNGTASALVFDPMFAAGGDVFLDATRISGSGAVKAQGAPAISVVNHSGYHLLLDTIEIPDNPGGHVNFIGAAGGAGGVRVEQASSTDTPSVLIKNTSAEAPAILAMENIVNIGGNVTLHNETGSIGQFGTVYAAQQHVYAPQGIVTFSNLNADYFTGSNPRSDWRFNLNSGLWSLIGVRDVDFAVAVIANAQYGGENLNETLYYRAPTGTESYLSGSSVVLFGACSHGTGGGQNNAADGCTGGPFGVFETRYQGNNKEGAHMPYIPSLGASYLNRKASYEENPLVARNAADNSFEGQQIFVQARYLDINSRISAGAGTNWSLTVPDEAALESWLSARDRVGVGVYEIPSSLLGVVGASSHQIGASYDAANRRILVDNVNASGGGYVYLEGRIVSTTPYGEIEVSSGFGQVTINSLVDRDVQLQDINVGSGEVGEVTIVDHLRINPDGTPYTVWYISRTGEPTYAVDNSRGATSHTDPNAHRLSSPDVYQPKANTRYVWTERADVRRMSPEERWYWVDGSGNRVDSGQEWRLVSEGFVEDVPGAGQMSDYEGRLTGGFSSFLMSSIRYACKKSGWCSYGYDNGYDNQTVPPHGTGGAYGHGQVIWEFLFPTRGYLEMESSVKADNLINISFVGGDHGLVDVSTRGDLYLGGRIFNPGGDTVLTTREGGLAGVGDIIRASDRAMLTARWLELNAAGGVGVGGRGELLVTLGEDDPAGTSARGIRVRSASNAGVNLDVVSDAPVDIVSGSQANGYGNVRVSAGGSISGLNRNAQADITGASISLESRNGGIGSMDAPLRLRAHETMFKDNSLVGGIVSASASGDIALRDGAGDFWVDSVHSRNGDVWLDAADGSLLDASLRLSTDGLSQEQIEQVRERLGLYGTGVEASVEAFEKLVDARYREYWQLLGFGQVVDGVFVPDAGALPLFRVLAEASLGVNGATDEQVAQFLRDHVAGLEDFFADELGPQWRSRPEFASYDPDFGYVIAVDSERYQEFSRNATWTEAQLRYAINANALRPSGGAVGDAEPSISGRNVRLQARDGLGRLAPDLDIDYAALLEGNLDESDALTLALANTPGDVVIIDSGGRELTLDDLGLLDPDELDAIQIAYIRVKRTSPLFIQATGEVSGSAGGSAFLQGSGDLLLSGLDIGQDARLTSSGHIRGVAGATTAVLSTGGDLVLSASGGIGHSGQGVTADDPLLVDVGARLASASAGQHLLLRQANGDLRFGPVFANGRIGLDAPHGSLLSFLDDISLFGRDIQLSARDDIAGDPGDGALRALKLDVSGGKLDAEAGGRIWISSPERSLDVGTLRAGDWVNLLVEGGTLKADSLVALSGALTAAAWGDLHVGLAQAGQGVTLTSLGNLVADDVQAADALLVAVGELDVDEVTVDGAATLQAGGAVRIAAGGHVAADAVDIQAASLGMASGSRIDAQSQVRVHTQGDQQIGQIDVDGAAGSGVIELDAGGRIAGNAGDATHLSGGPGVDARLVAGSGIGDTQQPLRISVGGQIDGTSDTGDINLHLPDGGDIGSLVALGGNVVVEAGDLLGFGSIQAAQALHISGTGIQGQLAEAGEDGLWINAGDDVAIDAVRSAGAAMLAAGGSVALGAATVHADTTLMSEAHTTIDMLTVGGDLDAVAGTTFAADTVVVAGDAAVHAADIVLADGTVGGDANLTSIASTTLGRLQVAQVLAVDAGTRLDADLIEVGGDALLVAGTDATVDTLSVDGALTAEAVTGRLELADATVDGDASLASGADTHIGTLAVDGDLDAVAGATFAADTVAVAGDAAVHAADLALRDGTVGGDANLTSTASTTLGRLQVAQALAVDAGTRLDADLIEVGGDAVLVAGIDATIDTLSVGGALTAEAITGDLELADATVDGDASLASGADTHIGTLAVGGDLDAVAGATFAADTVAVAGDAAVHAADIALRDGTVGGDANLTSIASTTLGRLQVVQALAVDAGTRLDADLIEVGGDAVLVAGIDASIDTLSVGGALTAEAITGDLELADATVDGDASLASGADTHIGTLAVGGDLDAVAGATFAADTVAVAGDAAVHAADIALRDGTVGGDANLTSTASTTLGRLQVAQALAVDAGTRLDADLIEVGGDAVLMAGTDASIDTLSVNGALDISAGRNLTLGQAGVGGNAALVSGHDTRIDLLEADGAVMASAGRDFTLGSGVVGDDARLEAGRHLAAEHLAAGGNIAASAGVDAGFGSLVAQGDIQVVARAGDVVGSSAMAGRVADFDAGRDVHLDAVEAGDRVDVRAGRNVDVGSLVAHGTDVRVDAGHDLDAARIQAARDVLLTAGNAMRLGSLQAGRDLVADAAAELGFETLEASRDLRLRSRHAGIAGGHFTAGRDAGLEAAASVHVDGATAGNDLVVDAGQAVALGRYRAGGRTRLDAGGDIRVGEGRGVGEQHWAAGGDIAFGQLHGGSAVYMDARGGELDGALLEAPEAHLAARDRIGLDLARVDSRLNLASAEIAAGVVQTGTGSGPLSMVLTGYQDGVARRIELSVDARDAWIMDRLAAVQAELDTTVDKVDIVEGHIGESMRLTTPVTRTWMHNQDQGLRAVDLQLTEPGMDFMLSQRGRHTFTDAYVVRYAEGFWVEAPNHHAPHNWTDVDYRGESALRYTFRVLEGGLWGDQGLARHPFVAPRSGPVSYEEPVRPVEGAVNTGISP